MILVDEQRNHLRYNGPDSVVILTDETRYLLETKEGEDIDVAQKARAARVRCENATLLTGEPWANLKIPQAEFGKLCPDHFADLFAFAV